MPPRPFVVWLVDLWVRVYCLRLPEDVRQRRREEVTADVYDHLDYCHEQGDSLPKASLAVLGRALRGVGDDLRWRREQERVAERPFLGIGMRALAAAALIGLAVGAITWMVLPDRFEGGQVAAATVVADRAVQVLDQEGTERARREAFESVAPILQRDEEAAGQILADVRRVFAIARNVRTDTGARPVEALTQRTPLSPEVAQNLLRLDADLFDQMEAVAITNATRLANQRLTSQDVDQRIRGQFAQLLPGSMPGTDAVLAPLLSVIVRPTLEVDTEATQAAKRTAVDAIEEVTESWTAGESVVEQGTVVSTAELRALRELGATQPSPLPAVIAGLLATAIATAAFHLIKRRSPARPQ